MGAGVADLQAMLVLPRSRSARSRFWTLAFASTLVVGLAFTSSDAAAIPEEPIALGEIAPPPPSSGLDLQLVRTAAEGELRRIDTSHVKQKGIVVSLAVTKTTDRPVGCAVSAMIRDRKSGSMIAIVQGEAHAEGDRTADLKKEVGSAAVRSAVRQVPLALAK